MESQKTWEEPGQWVSLVLAPRLTGKRDHLWSDPSRKTSGWETLKHLSISPPNRPNSLFLRTCVLVDPIRYFERSRLYIIQPSLQLPNLFFQQLQNLRKKFSTIIRPLEQLIAEINCDWHRVELLHCWPSPFHSAPNSSVDASSRRHLHFPLLDSQKVTWRIL